MHEQVTPKVMMELIAVMVLDFLGEWFLVV